MNDRPLTIADDDPTPEAVEARMRATRAEVRAHLASARAGVAERARAWPFVAAGGAALAGLALALARGRSAPAPAPRGVVAKAPLARFAALAGWALRVVPLARGWLHRAAEGARARGRG